MVCVPAASVRTALVVGVVLLGLVGCGGNGGGDGGSESAASSPGAKVFADAGCGNCHTMAAADATGTTGPSLDDLKPEKARVARQVRNGGVGAEIAARIGTELFDELDAPVARVGCPFAPIPFAPELERALLPGSDEIVHGVRQLLGLEAPAQE